MISIHTIKSLGCITWQNSLFSAPHWKYSKFAVQFMCPYSGGSSGTAASAMLCVWHPFFQADLICLRTVCSLEQLGLHVTTLPIHHCIISFMCLTPQMGISILHSSICTVLVHLSLSLCSYRKPRSLLFIILFSVERRRFKEGEGWYIRVFEIFIEFFTKIT